MTTTENPPTPSPSVETATVETTSVETATVETATVAAKSERATHSSRVPCKFLRMRHVRETRKALANKEDFDGLEAFFEEIQNKFEAIGEEIQNKSEAIVEEIQTKLRSKFADKNAEMEELRSTNTTLEAKVQERDDELANARKFINSAEIRSTNAELEARDAEIARLKRLLANSAHEASGHKVCVDEDEIENLGGNMAALDLQSDAETESENGDAPPIKTEDIPEEETEVPNKEERKA